MGIAREILTLNEPAERLETVQLGDTAKQPITLQAATGNEIAYDFEFTVNKATSGNATGIRLNVIETAAPGSVTIIDLQKAGVSKLSVDSNGNVMVAGAVTVNGALTSPGFDDGATGTRLRITDTELRLGSGAGSTWNISHWPVSDGAIRIGGGAASNQGGGVIFYGATHAALANDTWFYSGTTNQGGYDYSASLWDFKSNGIIVGTPTGLNKGPGTINAVAVYDDNVLLTCYPFDQKLDGKISQSKWDRKVPDRYHEAVTEERDKLNKKGKPVTDKKGNPIKEIIEIEPAYEETRTHEGAAKFKQRIGTKYDPMDIDKYAQHWKDKRHLTAMPNESGYDPNNDGSGKLDMGNWIQRLIETVEVQAIHIETLNQRLKLIENQ